MRIVAWELAYHPSPRRGATASAGVGRDGFAACAAGVWRGDGIDRMTHLKRTGLALVKVAMAVLARWALVKYTRPSALPKQKVFARYCGPDVCSDTAAQAMKKLKHCIWMFK